MGGRDTRHVREIARPEASADRQLNALPEPAFLPLFFHPLDRNVRVAFLNRTAAASATERYLRNKNTFCLHGKVVDNRILGLGSCKRSLPWRSPPRGRGMKLQPRIAPC